jgi:hypothetical protein
MRIKKKISCTLHHFRMIVKRRILYANDGGKTSVLAIKKSITISPFERASVRVITVQSKFEFMTLNIICDAYSIAFFFSKFSNSGFKTCSSM